MFQIFFHKQAGVAERCLGHGGCLEKGVFQFFFIADDENAASAATAFRLEHGGQPHPLDDGAGFRHVDGSLGPGHHRNIQAHGQLPCLNLVSQKVHGFRCGTDEDNSRLGAFAGEALIFRREAPAGMDGDNAALFGLADDKIKIEIRIGIRAQQHEFLGRGCGGGSLVDIGGRHDGDGMKALADGAADAPGRDAAICDENGFIFEKCPQLFHRSKCHCYLFESALRMGASEPPINFSLPRSVARHRAPSPSIPSMIPSTSSGHFSPLAGWAFTSRTGCRRKARQALTILNHQSSPSDIIPAEDIFCV